MKEKFSSDEKFVANWLNIINKNDKLSAIADLTNVYISNKLKFEFSDWLDDDNNQDRLLNALVNDYEIEEEKYRVRLIKFNSDESGWLARDIQESQLKLISDVSDDGKDAWKLLPKEIQYEFTLAEIEAIDPRYLAFKEKVEV